MTEANDIIGRTIPLPSYLPYGFAIQETDILENVQVVKTVAFIISDQAVEGKQTRIDQLNGKLVLQISWNRLIGGLKLEGEKFDVSGGRAGFEGAVLVEHDDRNDLLWTWAPNWPNDEGFAFRLYADKSIPVEELVKMARSMSYWLVEYV